MIRRPPRSTRVRSSAASDVYKRQFIERALALNLNQRIFSTSPTTLYEITELGIPESDLPHPTGEETDGRRKGATIRKWLANKVGTSSTDMSNISHYGAVYRRVHGGIKA